LDRRNLYSPFHVVYDSASSFLNNLGPCTVGIFFLVLAISFVLARIRNHRSSTSIGRIIPFPQEEDDSWMDDIPPDDYTG